MLDKLKDPKTWIGAAIVGAIAAAVFLLQAAGVEPPAALVDELEALVEPDGSGDVEAPIVLDGSGDVEPPSEGGSAEGSGE